MFLLIFLFAYASCGPATEFYKDQFCTDPRTMKSHKAYTEWADAYSCSRHRCQPGGRSLAIYTVGCKRVEAPESALECEEVVEDTNMQFPYCCTRLRCLVLVRGEIWTRVLGQPWETLPAAPWSHMYKMKKPPPGDTTFVSKTSAQTGPVYELTNTPSEKVMRASSKDEGVDNEKTGPVVSEATPDIIIALDTENSKKIDDSTDITNRHNNIQKMAASVSRAVFQPEVETHQETDQETTEKPEPISEERSNQGDVAQRSQPQESAVPASQWNEHETTDRETTERDALAPSDRELSDKGEAEELVEEKPSKLQSLVDAIGTRMRDIENVVQKMSERVQEEGSPEKRAQTESDTNKKEKKPSTDNDHYNRFAVKSRSKYVHTVDGTTELPSYIEDTKMNGYFSDAANNILRRSKAKEHSLTYMAPVENRRKAPSEISIANESTNEHDKKHKKHGHKKKKGKRQGHKKHHAKDKERKHRLSAETERNAISLEDSSAPNGI